MVDTGNGMVSHSEGQGYGMLLAVAANDRPTFDKLWGWTRANLMVRDDQLMAWRWIGAPPRDRRYQRRVGRRPADRWALAEGAEFWGDISLKVAARAASPGQGSATCKLVIYRPVRHCCLPAVSGFTTEDRRMVGCQSLSYWFIRPLRACRWSRPRSTGAASRRAVSTH